MFYLFGLFQGRLAQLKSTTLRASAIRRRGFMTIQGNEIEKLLRFYRSIGQHEKQQLVKLF